MGQNWFQQLPEGNAKRVSEVISSYFHAYVLVPMAPVLETSPLATRTTRMMCFCSYVSYLHHGPESALAKSLTFSERSTTDLGLRADLEKDLKTLHDCVLKAAYE